MVVGLQSAPLKTIGWWLGLVSGLLVPLTMAAGAMAGAALAAVGLCSVWAEPRPRARASWVPVILGLVLMAWGLCWRATPTSANMLYARSIGRWGEVATGALSWPWPGSDGWAAVVFAPAAWWAVSAVMKRRRPETAARALCGIAVWTLGLMMAMAYFRGNLSLFPASRYLDIVAPGVLACGLLWWWLPGRAARIGGVIWLAVVLAGVMHEGLIFREKELPRLRGQQAGMLSAAQEDIQDGGDGRALRAAGAHPSAVVIARVLRAGEAGGWLPPELLRPPAELWVLNQAMGTLFTGDSLAGSTAGWVSPVFPLKTAGVLVLTRGRARLSIEPAKGGAAIPLRRLIGPGGAWESWGARANPGLYRLRVSKVAANIPVTLLWPRPMRASAYETRNLLAHISTDLLIGAGVAWALALGWLLSQPIKRDFSSARR